MSGSHTSQPQPDPFVAATNRLEGLLAGIGDGEEELLDSMLSEEAPGEKLRINALMGALVMAASFTICALCGSDPWGGASLSLHSLSDAAVGALLAAPLAALRAWSWGREAAQKLPALDDIHRAQVEDARPWLANLQSHHMVLLLAMDTLPLLFLLLPAAQGGVVASYSHLVHNDALLSGLGTQPPDTLAPWLAVLVTASVAGLTKGAEMGVREEEFQVLKGAVENADRFYRLMAPQDAKRSALAFKAVAVSWMSTKEEAAAVAGAQALLDVLYFAAVWRWTGDLAAAAVVALLVNSVDYFNMYALASRGDRQAQ